MTTYNLLCIKKGNEFLHDSPIIIIPVGTVTCLRMCSRRTRSSSRGVYRQCRNHLVKAVDTCSPIRSMFVSSPVVNWTSLDTKRSSTMENWGNSNLSTPVTAVSPPCQKNTMSSVVYPSVSRKGQNQEGEERGEER